MCGSSRDQVTWQLNWLKNQLRDINKKSQVKSRVVTVKARCTTVVSSPEVNISLFTHFLFAKTQPAVTAKTTCGNLKSLHKMTITIMFGIHTCTTGKNTLTLDIWGGGVQAKDKISAITVYLLLFTRLKLKFY